MVADQLGYQAGGHGQERGHPDNSKAPGKFPETREESQYCKQPNNDRKDRYQPGELVFVRRVVA